MHIIYTYLIHISPIFAQKSCHVSLPGVLQETAELAQVSFGGRLLRTIGWVYECSADQFIASCWGNFTVDGQLQSWKDKILEISGDTGVENTFHNMSQHFTTTPLWCKKMSLPTCESKSKCFILARPAKSCKIL